MTTRRVQPTPPPRRARWAGLLAALLVAAALPAAAATVQRSDSLRVTTAFARRVEETVQLILPCLADRPRGTVVLLRGAESVAGSLMSATLHFLTHDQTLALHHVAVPPSRPLLPTELFVNVNTRTCRTGERAARERDAD